MYYNTTFFPSLMKVLLGYGSAKIRSIYLKPMNNQPLKKSYGMYEVDCMLVISFPQLNDHKSNQYLPMIDLSLLVITVVKMQHFYFVCHCVKVIYEV